jgi:serine/threonine protein kinase
MPAPMLSPVIKPAMLPIPSELGTDRSSCNYDGGSCGSDEVVFEGTQGEELQGKVVGSTAFAGVLGDECFAGSPRRRCISSRWTAGSNDAGQAASDCETSERSSSDGMATLYIQVELCREETLQHWICSRNAKVGGRSDQQIAREAKRIFHQCARALGHLHERSYAHRDVKPSNILFSQDGKVRLGDFGLAKALDDSGVSSSPKPPAADELLRLETENGSRRPAACAVGTPSYASPEQRTGEPLAVATDVYSLGLVLMELICPVQTQMERFAVLQRLREDREIPNGACLRPKCKKLANLALRMTEPEPSKRPGAIEIISIARQVRREAHRSSGACFSAPAAAKPAAKVVSIAASNRKGVGRGTVEEGSARARRSRQTPQQGMRTAWYINPREARSRQP